jgi:hypothetical protein
VDSCDQQDWFGLWIRAPAWLIPAEKQTESECRCVSMRTDISVRPFYSGDAQEVWRVQPLEPASFDRRESHGGAKIGEISDIVPTTEMCYRDSFNIALAS